MMMEMARLKNGSEEAKLVAVVMLSLRQLWDEGKCIVVYELAQLCKNPEHELFGESGKELENLGLVERIQDTPGVLVNGNPGPKHRVHESIRNIVLSAVSGEGLDTALVDPREAP